VRPIRRATPRPIEALWHRAYRLAFRLQRLYWWLFRPKIEGAYVAVWLGDRLLMIENSYRKRLSLPAGGLARGEAPVEAALRELREEVGIRARPEQLHFVAEIVSKVGYAEDHAHFYELLCDETPAFVIDRHEVVWADFMRPEEALEAGVVDVLRQYLLRERLPDAQR
jgi:8-oxo-dGTP pyrophosphatase MutT (NUDIX family)